MRCWPGEGGEILPPNPRLQRTPAAALPSPLSSQALGGGTCRGAGSMEQRLGRTVSFVTCSSRNQRSGT
jgi:hypothetical protein